MGIAERRSARIFDDLLTGMENIIATAESSLRLHRGQPSYPDVKRQQCETVTDIANRWKGTVARNCGERPPTHCVPSIDGFGEMNRFLGHYRC